MEKKVFIVGGGPSLLGFDFDLLRNKDTIVVNKAVYDVPNSNFFVTVDYTFLKKVNRISFLNSPCTKVFIAALSFPFLQEKDGRIVDTRFNLVYHLNEYDLIIKSYKQAGIGLTFKDFRTGENSGFCALQLAIILGYTEIYLLGIDLVTNNSATPTHYHGGYGEQKEKFSSKLSLYYDYFKQGLETLHMLSPEIKVFSLSSISELNKIIPYKNPAEILHE